MAVTHASPTARSSSSSGTTSQGPGFGLTTATALVVGSVIGTGVFALPSALAAYGPISLVSFGLVTVGAIALALTFRALNLRIPASGGPYVYARDAFGDFAGFLNAWSYWITAWAGNAAIVVAWVGYVEVFWNTGHDKTWSILIAIVGLWLPAAVNLAGVRSIAAFQVVTTILKFLPLVLISTIGLFYVKSANFGEFNASDTSALDAIGSAGALALFSYLGIETASVVAGRVRDPGRNVGRATVFGTLACALVYILGTVAVFGTVAHTQLMNSTAPFADAADNIVGSSWAGDSVGAAAVISGFGALVGWTLIVAEMPQAAARDGLFPPRFLQESKRGVPAFGIIVSTVLATALTILSYTRFDNVFVTIVLLSVVTAVVPYIFSAGAQIYWLVAEGRRTHPAHVGRDVAVAGVALIFSFWALDGSGHEAVFYGMFAVLLGIPVYVWLKASRGEYGEPGSPSRVDRIEVGR